jgi:hypothetical protein
VQVVDDGPNTRHGSGITPGLIQIVIGGNYPGQVNDPTVLGAHIDAGSVDALILRQCILDPRSKLRVAFLVGVGRWRGR